MAIHIIKSPSGDELVALPRAEYEHLTLLAAEALEDADDVAVYDAAMADLAANPVPVWPAPLSALLLQTKIRLAAVRKWRGLSRSDLAAKIGVQQGYLSDLETKRRSEAPATLARLAEALDVSADWLA